MNVKCVYSNGATKRKSVQRLVLKNRHHLRTRRRSHERYTAMTVAVPEFRSCGRRMAVSTSDYLRWTCNCHRHDCFCAAGMCSVMCVFRTNIAGTTRSCRHLYTIVHDLSPVAEVARLRALLQQATSDWWMRLK